MPAALPGEFNMGIINHPAAMPMPPAAISNILARFDRGQLEGFVSVAIDLMDLLDGDADLEDGNDQEAHDGDDQGDPGWIEWHNRDRRTLRRGGPEMQTTALLQDSEDAEADDPPEDSDADDTNNAEDEELAGGGLQCLWSGPGCPISDAGGEAEAR